MILPFFQGLHWFSRAPVTWCLFVLSCGMFIWSMVIDGSFKSEEKIELDSAFYKTQGIIYSQYLERSRRQPSFLVGHLAERIRKGASLRSEILGHLALRDSQFLVEAPGMMFAGDQVQISFWRDQLNQWIHQNQKVSSSLLGVTPSDSSPQWSWLTYIFAHGDFTHFVGNMIFLLILGMAIEPLIGGLGLLVSYLGFGAVSAALFLAFSPTMGAPLVGASGAVSGLMMLICVLYRGHWPIRFVYWLILPLRGFTGFIYLPAIFLAVFWLLTDLAGHLSTPSDLGGVAHLAHFGGALGGLIVGLVLLALNPYRSQIFREDVRCFELQPLI